MSDSKRISIKEAILLVDLEKAYERGQFKLAASIRQKIRELRGEDD